MRSMDRRGFLAGTASLGAGVILSGCGSSSSGGSSASSSRPKIGQEPGNMTILEWDGYQAAGTKAQTTKGIYYFYALDSYREYLLSADHTAALDFHHGFLQCRIVEGVA